MLESLASGTPIITTQANGASMFISQGESYVIHAGDVRALAKTMKDVMSTSNSPVGALSLKDHGKAYARKNQGIS